MKYVEKINNLIDELKNEGVSFVVIATKDFSDGYYRATTTDDALEDIHIEDLLSGIAKAAHALRERLAEIKPKLSAQEK